MRVLLAHPYHSARIRRGGERYLDDLAWWLDANGHQVTVATMAGGPAVVPPAPGVRVLELSAPEGAVSFGPALSDRLAAGPQPFDVVHALVPDAALAAAGAGLPVVYTVLGLPTAGWLARVPEERERMRAAGRTAAVTVALSQASAAAVRDGLGVPVRVLPPGTRTEAFPSRSAAPADPPVVLFSGAVEEPRKRLALLVAAMARLPEARLVVSGPGDPRPAFAGHPDVLARAELPGAGRREDLPAVYQAATVTAVPAVDEAFGLVVVESLASGTPVVVAPGSGPAEIVRGAAGEVGVVAGEGPAALAAALRSGLRLAADPATAPACAAAARAYDWGAVGPAHLQTYAAAVRTVAPARPVPHGGDPGRAGPART